MDCKELKPVNPKRNQSLIFIRRTDAGFARFKNDPKNGIILIVMQAHYNTENATRSQPATQVSAMLINYWARFLKSQSEAK